jgi:RNA polymerase sigma factor (sigma-70 family)
MGDEAATRQVLERFRGMLLKIASRYRHISFADALQEGYLSILTAMTQYDCSLGIPFAAYASRKVHGDVRTAMRRWWRYEDRIEKEDTEEGHINPLWDEVQDRYGHSVNSTTSEYALAEWRALFAAAGLSPRERLAMTTLMNGWKTGEVAKAMCVSAETVKTWRKRAMEKLRKVMAED